MVYLGYRISDSLVNAVIEASLGREVAAIERIDEPSAELSNALMRHPAIKLILATGGPGMVHAAYSSGIPAIEMRFSR